MTSWKSRISGLVGISTLAAAAVYPAFAQDTAVLKRGDAIVTGFSGTKRQTTATGADALDEVFIDPDGAALRILPLQPDALPSGQLIPAVPLLQIKARDIGQVFAVTIDDGLKPAPTGVTPNIYVGATSAYGLQIVIPDADGDGRPERIKKGHPNAEWMAGQFGPGGSAGSIWKIDGVTGAVSQFARLPDNSGPGIGDIVYDTASLHFYVSDLDTGLIHRIDSAGNLRDTYDHGVKGREEVGLEPLPDDGAIMDIHNATFDSDDPLTWRLTQPERRVRGLGINGGRLYYAVDEGPAIWSVSIKLDGAFGDDPRREFEISGTPGNHPISDIAFDGQGMMYVAQRGGVRGSYDYTAFTEAKSSVVFRYRREIPDDPATPGVWVPVPDEYAVGFPPDHRNTSGGLALGYGYDDAGRMRLGQCDVTLWTTGDNLRASDTKTGESDGNAAENVNGLQGTERSLVRPDNEPPLKSYFLDYDGRVDDSGKIGQVGDVEIWQPCDKGATFGSYAPMPYLPPNYLPPSYYPPGYVPPGGIPPGDFPTWDFNLQVDKEAVPKACAPGGLGFLCTYTVRVTNTGPDPYMGPVTVKDKLPAAPAGATMTFDNQPPWMCASLSSTEYDCTYNPAVLWPGSSIDLKVTVDTPAPAPVCSLPNIAHLNWPWGFGDANPGDDADISVAGIPAAHCPPVEGELSNLKLDKFTGWIGPICQDKFGKFECSFFLSVINTGPGTYNGPIKIEEQIPAGTTVSSPQMNCSNGAPATCEHAPVVLAKNQGLLLGVTVKVPKNMADDLACKLTNKAKIVEAAGGSDQNTDATDDEAQADATIPGTLVQCPDLKLSNLKIKKTNVTGGNCKPSGGNWECKFKITVTNFGKFMQNKVSFFDTLSMKPGTITFQTPANWSCAPWGFPNIYTCTSDNPSLGAGDSADIFATVKIPIAPTAQCQIKNGVQLFQPPANTSQNTFGGDDKSDALAQLEAIFPLNGNPYCLSPMQDKPDKPITTPEKQDTNLSITKTAGATVKTATGQNTPFVITVTNTGPGTYNGPIVVRETLPGEPSNASWSAPWGCEGQTMAGHPDQALCSHPPVELKPNDSITLNLEVEMPNSYVAPTGSNVTCGYTNKVTIEEAAGGTPQNTNAGDDTATAEVKFAPFEKHGQKFCGIDDLTTPTPPDVCPQGWSHTPVPGKCCPPRTRWTGKRCERGTPPDTCKPKTCDRNETWDGNSCSCVEKDCPTGTVGDYPNCKPDACPSGYVGTPPNCTRRIVDPPKDSCKPQSCGRRQTWDRDRCSCVPKHCEEGFVGRFPECKRIIIDPPRKCPDGFSGSFPNCKRIVVDPPKRCPDGFVGKPPKCKRIPPPKCPDGFRGSPPNCKRIVIDPPRRCPSGMVGKPPNCRKIEIHKPCPPGFAGRAPHCKKIRIPHLKPQQFQKFQPGRGFGGPKMRFNRLR